MSQTRIQLCIQKYYITLQTGKWHNGTDCGCSSSCVNSVNQRTDERCSCMRDISCDSFLPAEAFKAPTVAPSIKPLLGVNVFSSVEALVWSGIEVVKCCSAWSCIEIDHFLLCVSLTEPGNHEQIRQQEKVSPVSMCPSTIGGKQCLQHWIVSSPLTFRSAGSFLFPCTLTHSAFSALLSLKWSL